MVSSINNAIIEKLHELYPSCKLYDEKIPQNFKIPSFLLTIIEQDYNKRLDKASRSTVSYDLAYFTDKKTIKNDCFTVQQNIFRNFDLVGGYRVYEKNATVVDDVLHITFKVNYSEVTMDESPKMQEKIIIERGI